MTDSGHISLEDLALHAMRSLSPEESAAIHAHLISCAGCRRQLSELSGDLGLLGLSVEQHPLPEGARQRFLNRIAAAPPRSQQAPQSLAIPLQMKPRRRAATWAPWLAAVAMAILAVALGLEIGSLRDQLRDESSLVANLAVKASRGQQVLELLTSPAAQRVTLTPGKASAQPAGRAIYLPERGGLIFQASNLQPLPESKTYELWIIPANGKSPIPAGLFRPDSMGAADLVLPPIPTGVSAKAFGVTVEKAGGSNLPTTPILLSGSTSGM